MKKFTRSMLVRKIQWACGLKLVFLGIVVVLVSPFGASYAQRPGPPPISINVDCDAGQTISQALTRAAPGNTIFVTGTCLETITIMTDQITIDGQGSTVIDGQGATEAVVTIDDARDVTLKNLSVQDGSDGIVIRRLAAVVLDGVTTEGNAGSGMMIADNSSVEVGTFTSRNNLGRGIFMVRGSSVTFADGAVVSTDNVGRGIQLSGGSNLVMLGDVSVDATNNGSDGIAAFDSSSLLIFVNGNTISASGNGNRGIVISNTSTLSVGNTVINAVGNGNDGIGVFGASRAAFTSGSTILSEDNTDGVAVSASASLFVSDDSALTIRANSGDGLQVTGNSDADIRGTTVITGNGSQGALIFESSSLRLRGTALFENNLTGGSREGALQVSRSSNASLRGTITIRNNPGVGLWVLQESHAFYEGGTLLIEGNGIDGIQVLRNSQLELSELVSPLNVQILNNDGHGISFFQRSSGRLAAVVTIDGNSGDGLRLRGDSAVVGTDMVVKGNAGNGVDIDDGSADISNSTVTGNSGVDVSAAFGSRLTLNGNTINAITCDATVLSRGSLVCP